MGNIWGIHQLVPHPDTPPKGVEQVGVQILGVDTESVMIEYFVRGTKTLVLPKEEAPDRADGLWKTTCFEAFLKDETSDRYFELNFSPSSAWAAYSFDRYREGMADLPLRLAPEIVIFDPPAYWRRVLHDLMRRLRGKIPAPDYYFLSAEFDPPRFSSTQLSLTAVIEETDGTKSYWALRHPPGKPDFHHPDCFALELPALA